MADNFVEEKNKGKKTPRFNLGGKKVESLVVSNYRRSTTTGNVKPTKKDYRLAHYVKVDKDNKIYLANKGIEDGNGIPFTETSSGNTYILVGYQDGNGYMQANPNASADLQKDYANYNQGKDTELTRPLLETVSKSNIDHATRKNEIEGVAGYNAPIPGAQGTQIEVSNTATVTGNTGMLKKGGDDGDNDGGDGEEDTDISPPAIVSIGPITANSTASGLEGLPGRTIKYPDALITDETDYLKIGIRAYKRISADGTNYLRDRSLLELDSTTGQKNAQDNKGYILLPIPANIQDTNAVKYTEGSMDAITAIAAEFATRTMESSSNDDPIKKIQQAFSNGAQGIGNLIEDGTLQKVVTNSFAAEALNALPGVSVTRDQLLARGSGGIINPNMELLFNGVTLRTFRFSFKLTPRNDTESKNIKTIIRVFKKNMAPKAAKRQFFLATPNIFDLQYMKGGGKHPFLNSFKSCALTDMSVNYTGDGTYATYADATPVSMVMDLTFRELEAVYDEDYDKVPDTEGVGF